MNYEKGQRVIAIVNVNPEETRYDSGESEVEYEICRRGDLGTVVDPAYGGTPLVLIRWDAMYNCEDFPMRTKEFEPAALCESCQCNVPASFICETCAECYLDCSCNEGDDEDYLDEDDYNRYSV